jgi:hypothetical protein
MYRIETRGSRKEATLRNALGWVGFLLFMLSGGLHEYFGSVRPRIPIPSLGQIHPSNFRGTIAYLSIGDLVLMGGCAAGGIALMVLSQLVKRK